MIKMFSKSPVLSYGFQPGASASQLLALLSGQAGSTGDELQMYKRYNNAFYGTPMASGGIVTRPTNALIGQQFGLFIKNMGDSKTVLNVDGRQLAEAVGQGAYDINTGM